MQWTVIAYLLTLAVVIPASGWIGDRAGTKRAFGVRARDVHRRLGPVRRRAGDLVALGVPRQRPGGHRHRRLRPSLPARGSPGARSSLRQSDPILRLGLLRDRLFRATNIVFALSTGPFLASLYLTPIFLQEVMYQSPLASGTTTFVEAIGVGFAAQTIGRLYARIGPRVMAGFGAAGLSLFLALFLLVDSHTNLWLVRALMFFGGVSNSGAFLSVQTSMFTTISRRDTGHASAIYNTQRQSTIALNIAVLTTIVAGVGGGRLAAFHAAYLAGAIIAAVGTICAWTLIRTRDARSTMQSAG